MLGQNAFDLDRILDIEPQFLESVTIMIMITIMKHHHGHGDEHHHHDHAG